MLSKLWFVDFSGTTNPTRYAPPCHRGVEWVQVTVAHDGFSVVTETVTLRKDGQSLELQVTKYPVFRNDDAGHNIMWLVKVEPQLLTLSSGAVFYPAHSKRLHGLKHRQQVTYELMPSWYLYQEGEGIQNEDPQSP